MSFPETRRAIQARPRPRPEFYQLETFLKVVESGSFAAAARQSGKTQPAVSQAISRLEEFCGADLFERHHGAPLSLTPVGEAILPSARILIHTADELMGRMAATAQGCSGILSIGFEPWLAEGPLCSAIADFGKSHPDVRFRFLEAPFPKLRDELDNRALDIVVALAPSELAGFHLERETLWEDRFGVVMPADHSLARRKSLSWPDVRSTGPILIVPGQELAHRRLSYDEHRISRPAIFDLVANGFGVAMVLSSASLTRSDLVVRPIRTRDAIVAIDTIWRRDDANPLRHRLLTHLRGKTRGGIEDRRISPRETIPRVAPSALLQDH